jgi:hypothetical protein
VNDDADDDLDDCRQSEADVELRPVEHQHLSNPPLLLRQGNGGASASMTVVSFPFAALHTPALLDF